MQALLLVLECASFQMLLLVLECPSFQMLLLVLECASFQMLLLVSECPSFQMSLLTLQCAVAFIQWHLLPGIQDFIPKYDQRTVHNSGYEVFSDIWKRASGWIYMNPAYKIIGFQSVYFKYKKGKGRGLNSVLRCVKLTRWICGPQLLLNITFGINLDTSWKQY